MFPLANQRGCFFHLSQCVWRRVQSEGLQERYSNDPDFALQVRHLPALAYVPESDVITTFEELLDSTYYTDNEILLRPILDYFEDTWIGRIDRRGRRRQPQFQINLWNCYEAVKDGIPKTNNSVEGWHRGFSQLLSAHHPNIWKFIKGLKKEQSVNELKVEQYIAGN